VGESAGKIQFEEERLTINKKGQLGFTWFTGVASGHSEPARVSGRLLREVIPDKVVFK